MFLSKTVTHLHIIIPYIMEENIFVDIVYKVLEQQKNWNVILEIALKLVVNKELKCPKSKYVRFKNYEKKIASLFMIFLVPKDNRKEN